jgi:uncharacterized protein HemX
MSGTGDDDDRRSRGPVSGEFPSDILARVPGADRKAVPQGDDAFREYVDDIANTAARAYQRAEEAMAAATRASEKADRADAAAEGARNDAHESTTQSKTTSAWIRGGLAIGGAIGAVLVGLATWYVQSMSTRVDRLSEESAAEHERLTHAAQRTLEARTTAETVQQEKRELEKRVRDLEEKLRFMEMTTPRRTGTRP